MKRITLGMLPILLVACADGPFPAPGTAAIQEFDDLKINATSAHIVQDGVGTLVFADVLVYDEMTDMPLNNIEVEILTGWSGVYVIPDTAIKQVDYPSAPADVMDGSTPVSDYCDTDNDGRIDAGADDWCSWWWDIEGGGFFEFSGDYAMTADNYQPTYMLGATDNRGVMRFYLFIDSLPSTTNGDDIDFNSTSFWVSIGVHSVTGAIDIQN
jgi:hypothetical protein